MSIVNRRNAVLGWSVWQVSKQVAKRKARSAPSGNGGRPSKPALAVGAAGLAGATAGVVTFWRKRRNGGESS